MDASVAASSTNGLAIGTNTAVAGVGGTNGIAIGTNAAINSTNATGNNIAIGTALVDFIKLRKGAGEETNWLVTKLIQGEKRVKVTARIQSANGGATVNFST